MKSDIVPILMAVAGGDLGTLSIEWHDKAAVCVVMAAEGYPGEYRKADAIDGLTDAAQIEDVYVFHAGTAFKDGTCVTNGGRVLGVTALGSSVRQAIGTAYKAVKCINWKGVQFRSDIGRKALGRT